MSSYSTPWFQCMISNSTRQRLFVPDRIMNPISYRGDKFYLFRSYRGKAYPIVIKLIKIGRKSGYCIEDGWKFFIVANDIRNGDVVEMYYVGNHCFRTRVFRAGWQILTNTPKTNELPTPLEIEGSKPLGGDPLFEPWGPKNLRNDPPRFYARFTNPYITVGRLYVPVQFARENMNGYPESSPVQLFASNHVSKAVMRIRYNRDTSIQTCTIKRGVKGVMKREQIKEGQQVQVEFFGDVNPPMFSLVLVG